MNGKKRVRQHAALRSGHNRLNLTHQQPGTAAGKDRLGWGQGIHLLEYILFGRIFIKNRFLNVISSLYSLGQIRGGSDAFFSPGGFSLLKPVVGFHKLQV
jgi:hypothetical protein